MAKIDYVEQRLLLWAEWIAKGRSSGGGMLAMFNGEPGDGEVRYNIPLNDEECWHTDTAVMGLPDPLKDTVCATYVCNPAYAKARFGISASVLSQRLDRAHKLLWANWEPKTLSPNSLPTGF